MQKFKELENSIRWVGFFPRLDFLEYCEARQLPTLIAF